MAYRCLYCGAWFCAACAEIHFGKTIQQWVDAKRIELRAKIAARRAEQAASEDTATLAVRLAQQDAKTGNKRTFAQLVPDLYGPSGVADGRDYDAYCAAYEAASDNEEGTHG